MKMRVKYIGLNLVCRPYMPSTTGAPTRRLSPPPLTCVAPAGTWSVPRIPFCEMTRPMYFTVEFGYHAAREAYYSVCGTLVYVLCVLNIFLVLCICYKIL